LRGFRIQGYLPDDIGFVTIRELGKPAPVCTCPVPLRWADAAVPQQEGKKLLVCLRIPVNVIGHSSRS
jgi:hypothetical protein